MKTDVPSPPQEAPSTSVKPEETDEFLSSLRARFGPDALVTHPGEMTFIYDGRRATKPFIRIS